MAADAHAEEPPSAALDAALAHFTATSQALFASAAGSARRGAPGGGGAVGALPAELLDTLVRLDDDLAALVERARTHADVQARIEDRLRRIRAYDAHWRDDVREVHRWKRALDDAVAVGRDDRRRIEQAAAAGLDAESILAYARRIANFTSAPPQAKKRGQSTRAGGSGQAVDWNALMRNHGAEMPWPDAVKLRSGRLAEQLLAKSGPPVGETQGVETTLPPDDSLTRRPPQARPAMPQPAAAEDDSDDEFDIDLL